MKLGEIDVRLLSMGPFYLDGGSLFGSLPKPAWERKVKADERNRVRLAMNALLVRAGGKTILVDAGAGGQTDAKMREIFGLEEIDPLPGLLAREGVRPEEVDVVINTHLHFDHAGGNTRLENGRMVPSFPRARYYVQRAELANAMKPSERDRASYVATAFTPITEAGQWELLDGDGELFPGISVVMIPGHNLTIQAVKICGGGKTVFSFADLFPTRHHLPPAWIAAVDLYPMTTLETKKKFLPLMVREEWIAIFGHDPEMPAATFHERDGKIEAQAVELGS